MILLRTAVAALLLTSTAAFAQTTPPVAAAPAAPIVAAPANSAQPTASDLTKDGKPRMKVVRAQCRDTVKGENLQGDARKQAMAACIIKQRPDMEASMKCRMGPSLKGMDKAAKHTAIKACVAKTKA